MQYVDSIPSPLGDLTVASDGQHLTGLWLPQQKYFRATVLPDEDEAPGADVSVLQETRMWLERYFAGENPGALPAVKPAGSAFRQRVWQLLCEIPYGQLTTYGDLARQLAAESPDGRASARAVGGAVGHNPISILVPCHRVIGSGRNVTGYAGGLERKLFLLRLEGIDTTTLRVPTRGTAL